MSFRWKYAAALCLLALVPRDGSAQMEQITDATYRDSVGKLSDLRKTAKNPDLREYLGAIGEKTARRELVTAARVAADVSQAESFAGRVVHYAVPAMSDLQRLPDVYPLDGTALAPVRIVSAQDEYEPGSFVVYPLEDLGKVEFRLSEFKSAEGKVFPADKLDLKVIKVWYQNGNGWYNYFGDTELKLVPELLLNDEDLIRVDTDSVQNYARLTEQDGSVSYFWLTPPQAVNRRVGYPTYRAFYPFQPMKPNFRDAKTLQPVTLNKGLFKQFFLTVRTEKDQAPGLYKGAVSMVRNGAPLGTIPVTVKVLPFALPKPCAYYDTDKDFLVSSYSYISFDMILWENGGDYDLMLKQYEAVLADQVRHNQTMHMLRDSNITQSEYNRTLDIMKRAGMRMDYIMGGGPIARATDPLEIKHDAKMQNKLYRERLGHTDVFFGYGDEPPTSWVRRNLPLFKTYQDEGFKFFIAGKDQVFYAAGFLYDFYNTANAPEQREATRRWNEVGHAWVAWYAAQHVGVENPMYNRRQNGMAPYLGNYSALCNYAHHFGPYNDRSTGYKPMVFAYGCGDGVLDTLQWEGFREGVDDIRYATMLKRLAVEASSSKELDIQYAGRQALQFFAELSPTESDLNETRLEMVSRILTLRAMLKK